MAYEEPTISTLTSSFQSSIAEALSNVDDPTSIEKRHYIYMREPDVAADGFDGYPFAYVEDYSLETETATINDDVAVVNAELEIVVDAEDEDVEMKKHHDELCDNILHVLLSTERLNLDDAKLSGIELERDSRATTVTQTGKPIIRRTMTFTFDFMVTFSAGY